MEQKKIIDMLETYHQVTPDGLGYGGNGGVKVEVMVSILEVAKDARERAPEQAATPLFNKLANPLSSVLQTCHHVGEEAEVTGVIVRMGMRGIFVADVAQRRVGPVPEVLEHEGMHALQRPPLKHFLPAL